MTQYRGRFAPSPSGDLHFGSLVAALGSYLDAKANNGQWLLRMEDIDPPREVVGASDSILRTLESFGLHWDGDVVYQSQRHEFYQYHLDQLITSGNSYACDCSRKMIMAGGGLYSGRCKGRNINEMNAQHSIRFNNTQGVNSFDDRLLGPIVVGDDFAQEDFILKRKDGLFAYQLVVVLDDMAQGITHVVRGRDLLEITTRQVSLANHLHTSSIKYLHLPLAITSEGLKLSKQNHAKPLDLNNRKKLLNQALAFLGQKTPSNFNDVSQEELLRMAIEQWDVNRIPKSSQIL
ncbi:tRNA glutamyl-Q(34) synthetase GluQRS [Psychrobium sp. nBUS_13]|uniref:tRNA glutamyl-Q(34) synthetase GluQRS n=1 Tax=Psychrobium sp. nBUS_13 TaxID=3395319 RepID=UPI003EBCCBC0